MSYANHAEKIRDCLGEALAAAEAVYVDDSADKTLGLGENLRRNIDVMNDKADSSATAAFTNLVTGLAIKVAYPDIDVRRHQIQIQDPPHFNHRGVSENVTYPFLRDHDFDGAKSGWQTRTLERPKPYLLTYDENISAVKAPFLQTYHDIEEGGADARNVLIYLLIGQIEARSKKQIDIIAPNVDDISVIMSFFESHFFAQYGSRGASRLPVLALHSLYRVIIPQLRRYNGLSLQNLQLHSAADSQTGATGDIEISKLDGAVFEAVEVKHNIPIDLDMVRDSSRKLISRAVDRFYILTTHSNCGQSPEVSRLVREIRERTGCQVIVNGVLPTLRYYLRLVEDPSEIFSHYVDLLKAEPSISHEHRTKWNEIVLPS